MTKAERKLLLDVAAILAGQFLAMEERTNIRTRKPSEILLTDIEEVRREQNA